MAPIFSFPLIPLSKVFTPKFLMIALPPTYENRPVSFVVGMSIQSPVIVNPLPSSVPVKGSVNEHKGIHPVSGLFAYIHSVKSMFPESL